MVPAGHACVPEGCKCALRVQARWAPPLRPGEHGVRPESTSPRRSHGLCRVLCYTLGAIVGVVGARGVVLWPRSGIQRGAGPGFTASDWARHPAPPLSLPLAPPASSVAARARQSPWATSRYSSERWKRSGTAFRRNSPHCQSQYPPRPPANCGCPAMCTPPPRLPTCPPRPRPLSLPPTAPHAPVRWRSLACPCCCSGCVRGGDVGLPCRGCGPCPFGMWGKASPITPLPLPPSPPAAPAPPFLTPTALPSQVGKVCGGEARAVRGRGCQPMDKGQEGGWWRVCHPLRPWV